MILIYCKLNIDEMYRFLISSIWIHLLALASPTRMIRLLMSQGIKKLLKILIIFYSRFVQHVDVVLFECNCNKNVLARLQKTVLKEVSYSSS